jgi:tRNA(Ile)-lysidine synthetase-like protein
MSAHIIDFWKRHRDYWITPPSKQQEVDKVICDKFWTYVWTSENLIGQIIYLDQFSRHFARAKLLTEAEVSKRRRIIIDIIKHHLDSLKVMDEIEIVFALMPFKHLKQYDFIFDYLHEEWLQSAMIQGRHICDFPDLQRFYIDTYKKAFTFETVKADIISNYTLSSYDAALICEYYPDEYSSEDWFKTLNLDNPIVKKLIGFLPLNRKVTVSLSGGVDSMVMLLLLKKSRADVSAIHIVYGNRLESEQEYNFLANFCYKLGVPLFVYRIKWLRRGEIDRVFYEDMTRDLRFYAYRAIGETTILMGHIRDDIVENIWTNIAHCHHLGNLKKMEAEEVQHGVRIMRPLLTVKKEDIYEVSRQLAIPYLKNTTPSWSNRGKFREHFHGAVVTQFGENIDNKIIEFAEAVESQNKLLNMLLYDPIYNSFKDNCVDITTGIKARLDASSWLKVFEHICHMKLGVARPSIKCMRHFCTRLYSCWNKELNLDMGGDLKIKIRCGGDKYMMEFITS